MTKPIRANHLLLKIINSALIDLPSPSNISYMWNMGSLLGVFMAFQIMTGLFLALHFTAHWDMSFSVVSHITHDVTLGWLIRSLHSNGASLLFICLYLHAGWGLYFNSFHHHMAWMSGTTILLILMATTFLGYVLPWGQMSFWAATVITNLLSTIPYLGNTLVQWVWGGFAVDNATLTRFFSFHFILPFIILFLIIIHLTFLHQSGSNNPLGLNSNTDKIPLHPYFSSKDLLGFMPTIIMLVSVSFICPSLLIDPENFIQANPLVTPVHIQPEWYFLFSYAILRSIPNKLGGLIALMMSIMILYFLPLMSSSYMKTSQFSLMKKLNFWMFSSLFILLTWIGARLVEDPYILLGQVFTIMYFILFITLPFTKKYNHSAL